LKIKNGEFPTPVSLGPRAVGWLEAEIDSWTASRIERSRDINHAEQALTGGSRTSK
jgi:prophage regulatory protein